MVYFMTVIGNMIKKMEKVDLFIPKGHIMKGKLKMIKQLVKVN
jgi:hypothetical protein